MAHMLVIENGQIVKKFITPRVTVKDVLVPIDAYAKNLASVLEAMVDGTMGNQTVKNAATTCLAFLPLDPKGENAKDVITYGLPEYNKEGALDDKRTRLMYTSTRADVIEWCKQAVKFQPAAKVVSAERPELPAELAAQYSESKAARGRKATAGFTM